MSTLKVDTIQEHDQVSAINLTNKLKIGGVNVEQGYTSSATEPSNPSIGDFWWDSTNEKLYRYINSEFKLIGLVDATPVFRGATQGVFASGGPNEDITLAMPTGTEAGDYAMVIVGGMVWGGSSDISINNGSFGSPTNYQWGYAAGQSAYMTNLYIDSNISSSLVTSGVSVRNNASGTEYKLVTLLTFKNTTPLVAHTQINYGSNSTGVHYTVASGTRPTGYDSLSGGGIVEVHTTREGNRTYKDANAPSNYSDLLGTVNRSNIYIQAVYQNYSDNDSGYGQPYHRYLYNGGTVYSSSSLVIAY